LDIDAKEFYALMNIVEFYAPNPFSDTPEGFSSLTSIQEVPALPKAIESLDLRKKGN
jgi:hypothetical protein